MPSSLALCREAVYLACMNVLQTLREMRKLSRQELAAAAGIHYVTIVRLESNADALAKTSAETLSALARALDVPTAALLPR